MFCKKKEKYGARYLHDPAKLSKLEEGLQKIQEVYDDFEDADVDTWKKLSVIEVGDNEKVDMIEMVSMENLDKVAEHIGNNFEAYIEKPNYLVAMIERVEEKLDVPAG